MMLLGFSAKEFTEVFKGQQQDKKRLLLLFAPFILSNANEREYVLRLPHGFEERCNAYTLLLKDDGSISVNQTTLVDNGNPNYFPVYEKAIEQVIDCTYSKGMK